MPSNKKRVQALLDDSYAKKFEKLCEIEDRTESKLGEIAIKYYIDNYEQRNGNIIIGDITQKGNNNTIKIGN